MAKIQTGEIYPSNQGDLFQIISYIDAYKIEIKFLDEVGYTRFARSGDIRLGKIENPFRRSVHGVGFMGVGPYSSKDKVMRSTWGHILERCYDIKTQAVKYPSYVGCYVNDSWHNFQEFGEFFTNDPFRQDGWRLDKDLVVFGNKEYGPTKCAFVPPELNNLLLDNPKTRGDLPLGVSMVSARVNKSKPYFARVSSLNSYISGYFTDAEEAFLFYKKNKEEEVKKRAMKYAGKVDPRVIENLMNWEVVYG